MPRHMAGLCFLPSTPFRHTKESEDSVHAREGRGMENWKLIGWVLLVGGALFGVVFGWLQVGDGLWLGSYAAMLAGLTILLTNLIRTVWRLVRNWND